MTNILIILNYYNEKSNFPTIWLQFLIIYYLYVKKIYIIKDNTSAQKRKIVHNIPIIILEKRAGIYHETCKANILIYGKDYVAGSMACEYVSLCTKVPAVARGLYPRMPWETSGGEKIFGEGATANTSRRFSVQPRAFKPKECNYWEDQSQRNDVRDPSALVSSSSSSMRNLNIDGSIRRLTPVTAAFAIFPLLAATQRLVRCCRLFFMLKGDKRVAKKETKELSTVSISLKGC